jgi:hypothetical protein
VVGLVTTLEVDAAAVRSLYRIVLATIPFPASPMDTKTGFERPVHRDLEDQD